MPKIKSAHSKTEKESSSPLAQDTRDHTGKTFPSGSRPSFSLSSRARRTTSRSSASAPTPHSQTKKSSYAGAGGLPPCTEPSPLPPLADSRYSLGATHTEPENRLSLRQDHVPFPSRRRPAGVNPSRLASSWERPFRFHSFRIFSPVVMGNASSLTQSTRWLRRGQPRQLSISATQSCPFSAPPAPAGPSGGRPRNTWW